MADQDTFSAEEVEGQQPQQPQPPSNSISNTLQVPPSGPITEPPPSQDTFSAAEVEGTSPQESAQYGTPIEQAKAAAEGFSQGLAGFVAPMVETGLGISTPEAIRGRAEANPWIHGSAEVAGFGAGMFAGTGEAAVLAKAGNAAAKLAGLGEVINGATMAYKIGSAAVKGAAEMAVMQGSDEVSKMILKDPSSSAQSAITNMTLAAALGGVGSGIMTGAVSPLWNATAGPKVAQIADMFKNKASGAAVVAKDEVMNSLKTLGIDIAPELGAAMSDNVTARQFGADLAKSKSDKFANFIDDTRTKAQQSIQQAIPTPIEDLAHFSDMEEGNELHETFRKEDDEKFSPIADALDTRNKQAAPINISDVDRENQRNAVLELGLGATGPGANSEYYKHYEKAGQRLLDCETIGEVDKYKTELGNDMREAFSKGETNKGNALKNIYGHITNYQETTISGAMSNPRNAKLAASDADLQTIIKQRMGANASFKDYAGMQNELTNHLNVGDFKTRGTLKYKLEEKLSPEQLLKKFSIRNNAEFAPFMQQHYPETYAKMVQNETRNFLKPAVVTNNITGKAELDVGKLTKRITEAQKGKPELLNTALSPQAQERVKAANTLISSLPDPKQGRDLGVLGKALVGMPSSALATVGWTLGGPARVLFSHMGAELGEKIGASTSESYKLSFLKMLSSEQPTNPAGIKSMVGYMQNVAKGSKLMSAGPLFQNATSGIINSQEDRDSLDRHVTAYTSNPDAYAQKMQATDLGHYMPDHQAAAAQSMTSALQYCASIKPKPVKSGPLDSELPVSDMDKFRYNRCLDIANRPTIAYDHIRNGTLQATDVKDLAAMYPAAYKQMQDNITKEITRLQSEGAPIPLKIQQSASLFMGQAMNSSMNPASIVAAQPKPQLPPQGPPPKKPSQKSGSEMEKDAKSHRTASQSAEADRGSRD